ncbi:MAG: hypothetical protein JSU69_10980 [Candidatus Zixiibacteriota bacterium]|nr:MAG: hypothetical protein JSU69_10980 [candidate division Zixibacteria bacterium]
MTKQFNTVFVFVSLVCVVFTGVSVADVSLVFSGNPSAIRLLHQDRAGLTIELDIGKIDFCQIATPKGPFIMAKIDGFGNSFETGKPDLPIAGNLISVPFGCELTADVLEYEVEEISLTQLGLTDPIIPAQAPIPKSFDLAIALFEYDADVYSSDGYYSLPLVQTETLGTLRGLRLARVAFSPVEYSPTENKINVHKSVIVHIGFENPDWHETESMLARSYSPFFEPIYQRISNYEGFPVDFGKTDTADLVNHPVNYLIISDIMFGPQLQPFIEWKTKKGFNVTIAYTDEIGRTTTQIKSYIDSMYNALFPPPSFVLFAGDVEQIPSCSGYVGEHITDLRYCELTGDRFPEIYYGRFSAQTPAQLQPQIDKTLEYEKYEMPDPSYLSEVTLISGNDVNAYDFGNGQINYGTTYYFNLAHDIDPNVWLYPVSGLPGVADEIIQTVNDGIGLYNQTGHCQHEGFLDPAFKVDDVTDLTNYHRYLLGIGNCCESNSFGTGSSPCFGEAFLQAEDKGGIGYIGATDNTFWNSDYFWGVGAGPVIAEGPTYEQTSLGAYDGLFHDHGEPVSQHYVTNAAIIFAGNLGVTAAMPTKATYYWEIYHLMGDPSLCTYLGVPSENNVSHPETLLVTDDSITLEADPASCVGFSLNGALHATGYVDSSGIMQIPLVPFSLAGIADIVVTAQNRIPYFSNIMITTADGSFVIYDNHTVNDLTGNGDGLANCGETVSLDLQLRNAGSDTAFDVNAVLRTTDSFVDISDSTEQYGIIPGDFCTSDISDAFTFSVAGDAPNGHVIEFDLAAIAASARDTAWISEFSIMIYSPTIHAASVSVNDAVENDNGNLEPGETAEIILTLRNFGLADALSLTGVISEEDTLVTVIDADGSFGDLPALGGSGSNFSDPFAISIDNACPWNYETPLQLALTGAGGYVAAVDVDLLVGDRNIIVADDFSLDQGWSGLGGQGEWMIGPAAGGAGSDAYGSPDPAQDHTADSIDYLLGNDLSPDDGDYTNSLDATYWVTSPVFDCSGFTGLQLDYFRRLGVQRSGCDRAFLQAFDGSSWAMIFENTEMTIDDPEWVLTSHDVSDYADGNPNFQIRFGIGPTDDLNTYCGWNIDDLVLKGYGIVSTSTPAVECLPEYLTHSLQIGDSVTDTAYICNRGEARLLARAAVSELWVRCDTAHHNIAVGDSVPVPLTITTEYSEPGIYSGQLVVVSNDPDLHILRIPISLMVTPVYTCGDANGDGGVNILDVTCIINYLYKEGPAPNPIEAADADGSGDLNILDVTHTVNYLYKNGSAPVCQ